MKPYKENELVPVTPFPKPFKPEAFVERVKEFQDTMLRHLYDFFGPGAYVPEYPYHTEFQWKPEYPYRTEFQWAPLPIELTETEDGFFFQAEVPGFKEKELEVYVEPKRVYISGKREEPFEFKKGKTIYTERGYNAINRWFELPFEVVPEKVKAVLNKGVLEVTFLKATPAKKVPIEVKAA